MWRIASRNKEKARRPMEVATDSKASALTTTCCSRSLRRCRTSDDHIYGSFASFPIPGNRLQISPICCGVGLLPPKTTTLPWPWFACFLPEQRESLSNPVYVFASGIPYVQRSIHHGRLLMNLAAFPSSLLVQRKFTLAI